MSRKRNKVMKNSSGCHDIKRVGEVIDNVQYISM